MCKWSSTKVSLSVFGVLVLKFWGGYEFGFRKQNSRKEGFKWRFSSLIYTLPYKFLCFILTIYQVICCVKLLKYKKKFISTNMGLPHFKILIFQLFMDGGNDSNFVIHFKLQFLLCFWSKIVCST